jgi:hypothetical protein
VARGPPAAVVDAWGGFRASLRRPGLHAEELQVRRCVLHMWLLGFSWTVKWACSGSMLHGCCMAAVMDDVMHVKASLLLLPAGSSWHHAVMLHCTCRLAA